MIDHSWHILGRAVCSFYEQDAGQNDCRFAASEFSKHDEQLSILVLSICASARSRVGICLGKAHC